MNINKSLIQIIIIKLYYILFVSFTLLLALGWAVVLDLTDKKFWLLLELCMI